MYVACNLNISKHVVFKYKIWDAFLLFPRYGSNLNNICPSHQKKKKKRARFERNSSAINSNQ